MGEIDGDGFRADLRTVGFRGSIIKIGDKVGSSFGSNFFTVAFITPLGGDLGDFGFCL